LGSIYIILLIPKFIIQEYFWVGFGQVRSRLLVDINMGQLQVQFASILN